MSFRTPLRKRPNVCVQQPQTHQSTFVIENCRVAPVRQISIPTLKLEDTVYGARLRQLIIIENYMKTNKVIHRTGSSQDVNC